MTNQRARTPPLDPHTSSGASPGQLACDLRLECLSGPSAGHTAVRPGARRKPAQARFAVPKFVQVTCGRDIVAACVPSEACAIMGPFAAARHGNSAHCPSILWRRQVARPASCEAGLAPDMPRGRSGRLGGALTVALALPRQVDLSRSPFSSRIRIHVHADSGPRRLSLGSPKVCIHSSTACLLPPLVCRCALEEGPRRCAL